MSSEAPAGGELPPALHEETRAGGEHGNLRALALGALGIVYGDIGTSPLYALKECVHGPHAVAVTEANVLSLLSLIFWSITLVVSVKYLGFITRADNEGEGGILALLALFPRGTAHKQGSKVRPLVALVLVGAALLYGDGIITPAVSVLSAVEGLRVATDTFDKAVVPIAAGILIVLFAWQRRGTTSIGRIFGPVMLFWFAVLAVLGGVAIARFPHVLIALNPWYAVEFFARDPGRAFVVLGSVVLCITGGEALYADMGHFGRRPIQAAWYAVVYPALIINYFGQGALLLAAPPGALRSTIAESPFYALVPSGPATYLLVALATAAAVIASQALISGAFSLTRQAVQLGFLPRATVIHTSSNTEGQIYLPAVNWLLAVSCVALVLVFQESSKLAAAYGIAVTGTMGITSVAFYHVARTRWKWPLHVAAPLVLLFLVIDLAFLSSNALKFFDGGFVPVVVAAVIFAVMRTWKRGRSLLAQHFDRAARPLAEFLQALDRKSYLEPDGTELPIVRVPGVAVFLTSNPQGTPPLLLHHVRHVKSLQETVILATVAVDPVPRVSGEGFELERLSDGFVRLRIHAGFMESPDVPRALEAAIRRYQLPLQLKDVTYFLGRETVLATSAGEMGPREEALFAFLTRNSTNATRYFGIPPERVVEIGMQVDL